MTKKWDQRAERRGDIIIPQAAPGDKVMDKQYLRIRSAVV